MNSKPGEGDITEEVLLNDNRHPDEYWINQHPRLRHLPDLGFEFGSETDAYFRAKSEKHGIDYDKLKRTLSLSYQVIPEQPEQLALQLAKRNIISINTLKSFFESVLEGGIFFQNQQENKS